MIRLSHSKRNELQLIVKSTYIDQLLESTNLIKDGQIKEVRFKAVVDPKVLKKSGMNIKLPLILSLSELESLHFDGEQVLLNLNKDSLELLADFLEGLKEGELVMPEITDLYSTSWKKEKGFSVAIEK